MTSSDRIGGPAPAAPFAERESRLLLAFLRKLPHDFANAILPFQIAADLLRKAEGDAATLVQVQKLLEEQSIQAQRLIEDLGRTVRVLRGHVEIKPRRCDLEEVVAMGIAAARSRNAPSVVIERASPAAPIELFGDPTQLAAAVEELVDNAARYAGMNPIRVEIERNADAAVVRVCDQGPGIPSERLERIFDPFVAAETVESGWGIGLGYVRLVAHAHGGTVVAAPGTGGHGLTMTLRIPLRDAAAPRI